MKTIDLSFGRIQDEDVFFHLLSADLGADPQIDSFDVLKSYICEHAGLYIELGYLDRPYGRAGELVIEMVKLFEDLRCQLGPKHFDYIFIPRVKVILDLAKCRTLQEAYDEMRSKMEWLDWYGENLSALWDILTGLLYKGDDFIILRHRSYQNFWFCEKKLTEDIDKICQTFCKAQEEYHEIKVSIRYIE